MSITLNGSTGIITSGSIQSAGLTSSAPINVPQIQGMTTPLPVSQGGTGQTTGLAILGSIIPITTVKLTNNFSPAVSVETVMPFNVIGIDTTGAFNTTTYRYIPQIAGYYDIQFMLKAAPASATDTFTAAIRKNGVHVAESNQYIINGSYCTLTVPMIVAMNGTTDYIDFTVLCGTASSTVFGTSTGSLINVKLISRTA